MQFNYIKLVFSLSTHVQSAERYRHHNSIFVFFPMKIHIEEKLASGRISKSMRERERSTSLA